jgi:prolyl oligopeptidase PreP (S9A serine peptidase family)
MLLSVYSKLAYDDFIAVAEDLIARGVTSPAKLGMRMLFI